MTEKQKPTGIRMWLTTVDHKQIGKLYLFSALFFLFVGGFEALMIRMQLFVPDNNFLVGMKYNETFTMHGTTMVFLAVMPLNAAFFNFLTPLMIGARDVAFPRLNTLTFWLFFAGGLFLHFSYLINGVPATGWFGYANLSGRDYLPGLGGDFWVFSLMILGLSTLIAAINFFVTIVNMRTKGMDFLKMPVFIWTTLVTQVLIILSFPIVTVALILLMFDRTFGTNFYNPTGGGDVILWQHLFWVFGHPEVYILILPPMGIVSEVLPTFAKKPLFGYPVVVFSSCAIGFMGFTVWAHHMFTVGMGSIANAIFSVATMMIAIPTGVKIFNWLFTLWGGSIRFTTAMLFSLGFILMFTIGGLSGVMHASPPIDSQQHDTYFVVGHFHYILIGGAMMGIMSGFYYWFPKLFGRVLSETIGKFQFWLLIIGMNLTFMSMHILGLEGMPRRIYTYSPEQQWTFWNQVTTVGAFIQALSFLMLVLNVVLTFRRKANAASDPWDARTLEWSIPSPAPAYNFLKLPVVKQVDDFWYQKASKGNDAIEQYQENNNILLPNNSYNPLFSVFGVVMLPIGAMLFGRFQDQYSFLAISALGLLISTFFFIRWSFEPAETEPTSNN